MSLDLEMSEDWCKVVKDDPPHYGSSGKGEVPFGPEAWNGYLHVVCDNLGNSLVQAYAQMHRGLSFQHGICSRGRLPNQPLS